MSKKYDVIILGAGPAGLSAGVYTVRYGLSTLAIGKEPGGMASEATVVENYLGFSAITGAELTKRFEEHAKKAGVELLIYTNINSINKRGAGFEIETDKGRFSAKALIIALGKKKRKLQIPGEKELAGKGVSYCATCDAPLFKDKITAVIGGRNSAVTAALFLAKKCKKVYIVYRRDKLRSDLVLIERVRKEKKIEVVYDSVPISVNGKERVESLTIKRKDRKEELKLDGVFIEIGAVPSTELLTKNLKLKLDEEGCIVVKPSMATNVQGVFAAGDITNSSNKFDQIATAVGEGAVAANTVFRFLKNIKY